MPINHKHKLIFIHIPKCGGSSIERFFGMQRKRLLFSKTNNFKIDNILFVPQHLRGIDLITHKVCGPLFSEYTKFAFIRDPYERVVSEYYYKTHRTDIDPIRFKTWIFNYYKNIDSDHKLPQSDYIYDKDGNQLVDYIGTVENMENDFNEFLKLINYPNLTQKLKHDQVGSRRPNITAMELMDEECITFINKIYAVDFDNFKDYYIKHEKN